MRFSRSSGILLHITSLPSKFGIGDMGPDAIAFIDWLKECKQSLWQVLPLGVANHYGCPYSCFSAFGGYPLLISPEQLKNDGLLSSDDLKDDTTYPKDVNFDQVKAYKMDLFRKAFSKLAKHKSIKNDFDHFQKEQTSWIHDLALFLVLSEKLSGIWTEWPAQYKWRNEQALTQFCADNENEIEFQKFLQFIFHAQWNKLKRYATESGIKIIGDSPMFVSHHSMDVWKNPTWFKLNDDGERLIQTGSNPDEFSNKGQIWGSPNYNWKEMRKDNFSWWRERITCMLSQFDIIRLDYFKGFEATWEIPLAAKDGTEGDWIKGPGSNFFHVLNSHFNSLPIIVEDLGDIRPEVYDLRDEFDFTGMKILQFAFGSDKSNANLPYLYNHNCVVYTATHDNDTSIGYFHQSTNEFERDFFCDYAHIENLNNINWDLIKMAFESCADLSIIPLQDILGIGSEGRFNIPGTKSGNWNWRFTWDQMNDFAQDNLTELTIKTERNKR